MRINKKTKIAVLATALVIAGGAAFAYWTSAGSGSGTADTGTSVGVTIVQTPVAADALFPGGAPVALSGTFTNTNTGPVYVAQVTVAVDPAWTFGTGTPACTAGDFTLVQPTATNADVLANDTSTWGGASIVMINKATNQDNCKNQTVPLLYTSS
jgi:hypothetical protein